MILPLDNEVRNIPSDTPHMTRPDGWLAINSTADGYLQMDSSLVLLPLKLIYIIVLPEFNS